MAKFKPSNEQTMGEALSLFLDRYRLRRGFDDTRVLQAWDEILGPSIARQTLKKHVQNKVLVVQLENAVVRKELLMVKSKIVRSINEHLGFEAITELHLF
jgi:hypothetical protein